MSARRNSFKYELRGGFSGFLGLLWVHLLRNGCVSQATKAIDVAQDKDAELLAGFLRGNLDKGIVKYITDRDPALVGELKRFKSRYGSSWTEEPCDH